MHVALIAYLVVLIAPYRRCRAHCARCSGHGVCGPVRCECFDGWHGADCSLRYCPTWKAWVDIANDTDVAHTKVECSNMGICNRETGTCDCEPGWGGEACERMLCPGWRTKGHRGHSGGECNGRGTCMSMESAAATRNDRNLFAEETYDAIWDHDMIHGCVCWEGFTGFDCSLRECPLGDDPLTTGQVDEVQVLECTCDSCSGSFALRVLGELTRDIAHDATASDVQSALLSISSIRGVNVQLHDAASDGGGAVCDASGAALAITFTHNPGNIPAIIALSGSLTSAGGSSPSLSVLDGGMTSAQGPSSVDGTRERVECSGRGMCDHVTGTCECWDGFTSSDGAGGSGNVGDCGHFDGSVTPTCPVGGSDDTTCSGHGTCVGVADDYVCACYEGFSGGDCSLRLCPEGRSWFDEASGTNEAHADDAECSDMGTCNRANGECQCDHRFEGNACERMKCPLVKSQFPCSEDNGHCISIRSLAQLAEIDGGDADPRSYGDDDAMAAWDHSMVHGCKCDTPVYDAVAEKFGGRLRVVGYKCSEYECPTGDDPITDGQVDEQQRVTCDLTTGSFVATFRGRSTQSISFSADTQVLKDALEALPTIGQVQVSFVDSSDTTLCSASGVDLSITFQTEHGDVPLLSFETSTGTPMLAMEHLKGTREDTECSGRGLCDRSTGVCRCFDGFVSSDGMGDRGSRGDCSFIDVAFKSGLIG